jgi:hypothetical protein
MFPLRLPLILLVALSLAACGDDTTDDGTADTGSPDTGSPDTGSDDTLSPDADLDDAAGEDTVETDTAVEEDTAPLQPTLANVYATIFEPTCAAAGCHNNGANGVDFSTLDGLRDQLLANSPTAGFPLVTPNSPDDSYLWHKINNTQGDVGGFGGRMPVLGLPDEDIAFIEAWINAGAPE